MNWNNEELKTNNEIVTQLFHRVSLDITKINNFNNLFSLKKILRQQPKIDKEKLEFSNIREFFLNLNDYICYDLNFLGWVNQLNLVGSEVKNEKGDLVDYTFNDLKVDNKGKLYIDYDKDLDTEIIYLSNENLLELFMVYIENYNKYLNVNIAMNKNKSKKYNLEKKLEFFKYILKLLPEVVNELDYEYINNYICSEGVSTLSSNDISLLCNDEDLIDDVLSKVEFSKVIEGSIYENLNDYQLTDLHNELSSSLENQKENFLYHKYFIMNKFESRELYKFHHLHSQFDNETLDLTDMLLNPESVYYKDIDTIRRDYYEEIVKREIEFLINSSGIIQKKLKINDVIKNDYEDEKVEINLGDTKIRHWIEKQNFKSFQDFVIKTDISNLLTKNDESSINKSYFMDMKKESCTKNIKYLGNGNSIILNDNNDFVLTKLNMEDINSQDIFNQVGVNDLMCTDRFMEEVVSDSSLHEWDILDVDEIDNLLPYGNYNLNEKDLDKIKIFIKENLIVEERTW